MKEQTIDAMVRDFTSVVPRSKSELRTRIEELLAEERSELAEKIKGMKPAGSVTNYESEPRELLEKSSVLALLLPNEEGK